MTSNQIFSKLVSLRDEAGENHYERIRLAARLLQDKDWIADPAGGGGDENKAIDRLEAECFGDLCGLISLPQMLEIYHRVSDIEAWRKNKFNLAKVWADWQAKHRAKPKTTSRQAAVVRREYVDPLALENLTVPAVKREYGRIYRALETKDDKIARLEQENRELREENARLKRELKDTRRVAV